MYIFCFSLQPLGCRLIRKFLFYSFHFPTCCRSSPILILKIPFTYARCCSPIHSSAVCRMCPVPVAKIFALVRWWLIWLLPILYLLINFLPFYLYAWAHSREMMPAHVEWGKCHKYLNLHLKRMKNASSRMRCVRSERASERAEWKWKSSNKNARTAAATKMQRKRIKKCVRRNSVAWRGTEQKINK